MPRKKCVKKDFPVTTCTTKVYNRCEGWKGPPPKKPRKTATKKNPDKFYNKEYTKLKAVLPAENERLGKWKWQKVGRDGRKGPIEFTRFPPTNYKKFPHLFNIIEEGTEGR